MKTVSCSTKNGVKVECNVRTCAERRMIEFLKQRAMEKGVQRHSVNRWICSQIGVLHIERFTRDGTQTFSMPCIFCRRALEDMGIRWMAMTREGEFVNETNAPKSVLTNRQSDTLRAQASVY